MSYRLLRINNLIQQELSKIICKDLKFDNALVTINRVSVTPDLRQCHVYVSVLIDDNSNPENVIKKIEKRRSFIQQKIHKRVVLKNTPKYIFKLDSGTENSMNIVDIIENLDIPEPPAEEDDYIDSSNNNNI